MSQALRIVGVLERLAHHVVAESLEQRAVARECGQQQRVPVGHERRAQRGVMAEQDVVASRTFPQEYQEEVPDPPDWFQGLGQAAVGVGEGYVPVVLPSVIDMGAEPVDLRVLAGCVGKQLADLGVEASLVGADPRYGDQRPRHLHRRRVGSVGAQVVGEGDGDPGVVEVKTQAGDPRHADTGPERRAGQEGERVGRATGPVELCRRQ